MKSRRALVRHAQLTNHMEVVDARRIDKYNIIDRHIE